MTNRIKLKADQVTREECEGLVGDICQLKAQECAIKAEMDARLADVRGPYEIQLSAIQEKVAALLPVVRAWADANPEAFGKRKSLDLLQGTIGWRTGNPCLKTLRGWTWDRVLEHLRSIAALQFVRTKAEVNKERILADVSVGSLQVGELTQMGVRVEQAETFYVEPLLTATEHVEKLPAK